MAVTNIALLCQIKASNRLNGSSFKQEQCTLITILIFFGLSYLVRAFWDAGLYKYSHDEEVTNEFVE